MEDRIYFPEIGNFAYAGLKPNYHLCIVFEEFNIHQFDISILKRPLEGMPFTAQIKNKTGKKITWTKPIIMISNYELDVEEAIMNRLKINHADSPFYPETYIELPKYYSSGDIIDVDSNDAENQPSTSNSNQNILLHTTNFDQNIVLPMKLSIKVEPEQLSDNEN